MAICGGAYWALGNVLLLEELTLNGFGVGATNFYGDRGEDLHGGMALGLDSRYQSPCWQWSTRLSTVCFGEAAFKVKTDLTQID